MKTSRRDFLKLAGKATVAAATAGAAVKAGAEQAEVFKPSYVTTDDIDRAREMLDRNQVYVSSLVEEPVKSEIATNGVLRTSELMLAHFSMTGQADVHMVLGGVRPLNPLVKSYEFSLDVYYDSDEPRAIWGVYAGDPLKLIVDHAAAPPNARGEYNVVATDVTISAGADQSTLVTLALQEVK